MSPKQENILYGLLTIIEIILLIVLIMWREGMCSNKDCHDCFAYDMSSVSYLTKLLDYCLLGRYTDMTIITLIHALKWKLRGEEERQC